MPPGRELARGRDLDARRSGAAGDGALSRDVKVRDKDEGIREKRREGFVPSPLLLLLLLLFFLEKPKEVRRLDSILGLGPVAALMLSLDMGPVIEVGGWLLCFLSSG
jgi:hypothetical protein